MISPAARESAAIYRQWMQPMGVYWSMGSTVMGAAHLLGSVTLFRSREDGDFTDQEVELLRVLNRHLSAHFAFYGPRASRRHRKAGPARWPPASASASGRGRSPSSWQPAVPTPR